MNGTVTVKIIDKDKGFKALVDVMKRSKKSLAVGLPGSVGAEKLDGELTLAGLATVLEFGTDKAGASHNVYIHPRPFLSGTIDQNMQHYKQVARQVTDAVLVGEYPIEHAMGILGEQIVSDIKKNIIAGIPPGNQESTIRAKGSSTPLIDTGHLLDSITYEVKEG